MKCVRFSVVCVRMMQYFYTSRAWNHSTKICSGFWKYGKIYFQMYVMFGSACARALTHLYPFLHFLMKFFFILLFLSALTLACLLMHCTRIYAIRNLFFLSFDLHLHWLLVFGVSIILFIIQRDNILCFNARSTWQLEYTSTLTNIFNVKVNSSFSRTLARNYFWCNIKEFNKFTQKHKYTQLHMIAESSRNSTHHIQLYGVSFSNKSDIESSNVKIITTENTLLHHFAYPHTLTHTILFLLLLDTTVECTFFLIIFFIAEYFFRGSNTHLLDNLYMWIGL